MNSSASEKIVEYWTLASLRERGWTPALVARFLGLPDQTKCNPRYKCAAPMKLYAESRVLAIETREDFIAARGLAEVRSARGRKVADVQRQRLLALVRAMVVQVRQVPCDRLRDAAIRHYNQRVDERMREWESRRAMDLEYARKDAPAEFIDRITVNYIRHEFTAYDEALDEVARKVGVNEAAHGIRRKVYAEIAAVYPSLAEECGRQRTRRENGAV